MKLSAFIKYGFTLLILGGVLPAFAKTESVAEPEIAPELVIQKDNVFVPDSAIVKAEKNFKFDWHDYKTIEASKNKVADIEALLKKTNDYDKLSKSDQQALGRLLYKLGAFYTHVKREPDLAIAKLEVADHFLNEKEDKAWNFDHLAYAYELKYAATREAANREKSLYYTNKVIVEMFPNEKNKEVAFAYCVKGLVKNDALDYAEAEENYKKALDIYEHIPDGKDDQYVRAKSRLASIILDENGRDNEAISLLKEAHSYWQAKGHSDQNPYAARNLISLGQAYLKLGKAKDARDVIEKAIAIYNGVYGRKSVLLMQPYQLLSDAYKILGDDHKSLAYSERANKLLKG